jgi:hypothetical protein
VETKDIQRTSSFLGLFVLVTLIWYGRSAHLLLAGVPYLIAASCICGFLAASLRIEQRRGAKEPVSWFSQRRADVLLLVSVELVVIGLLDIQASVFSGSRVSVMLGYLLVGIFVIASYKMVALADSPQQDGGSKLLNYFGRPRSRRIFFCGFVYTPIGPLIILSLAWSGRAWCPTLLQPPQIWHLLLALLSVMSAGMVFQRYRKEPPNRVLAKRVFVSTIAGLVCTAVLQVFFGNSAYVWLFSSITVACMAATAYWLLLAKEAVPTSP